MARPATFRGAISLYFVRIPGKFNLSFSKYILYNIHNKDLTIFLDCRYVNGMFHRNDKGTIGVDFALKMIRWGDDSTVKIQLWDIAGL